MSRNSNLFLGHKWGYISIREMIQLFGIMTRISMEPINIGRYVLYFMESHIINIRGCYDVQLWVYNTLAKETMALVKFKKVRS